MQELIKKYNISEEFYKRFFRFNGEMNYAIKLQDFILFKRGTFLNPVKKLQYIEQFVEDEIKNFYEKGEINISKIDFDVTTRCTLKCKNCTNLMPLFNSSNHIDYSMEDIQNDLERLFSVVNRIHLVQIIGGESLINPKLADILEYCAKQEKIGTIKIITNGTVVPSARVIEVIKKYNQKIYFYISNYSNNPDLQPLLKHEKIIELLKANQIKVQRAEAMTWFEELPLGLKNYDEQQLKNMFKSCIMKSCISLLNHKIHICAKSASGYELGLIDAHDFIDLNSNTLRQDIIDFYNREYFDACKYCVRTNKEVLPAEQL